jgi:hypothetical protein
MSDRGLAKVIEAAGSFAVPSNALHPVVSPERSRFDEQRDRDEGNDDQGAAGDEHVAEVVSGRACPQASLLVSVTTGRSWISLMERSCSRDDRRGFELRNRSLRQ